MNKISFEEHLSDYIDGNMKDDEKEAFELILSNDKDLSDKVRDLKIMLSDISDLDQISLSGSFDIKLQESIDNYNGSKTGGFNIFKIFNNPIYATIGAIAAIILITVTTTLSIIGNSKDSLNSNNLADSMDDEKNEYNNQNDSNDFDIQRVDFDIKYEDY